MHNLDPLRLQSTAEFALLWQPNAMAGPTGASVQAATWAVRSSRRYRGSFACLTTAYLQPRGQVLPGHGPVLVCALGLGTLILRVDLCFLPTNLTNLPASLLLMHCQSKLLLCPTAIAFTWSVITHRTFPKSAIRALQQNEVLTNLRRLKARRMAILRRCCSGASVVSGSVWRCGPRPARLLVMDFSRQEHYSGLPCLPPETLPNPGVEPGYPALQADSLPPSHQGSSL